MIRIPSACRATASLLAIATTMAIMAAGPAGAARLSPPVTAVEAPA